MKRRQWTEREKKAFVLMYTNEYEYTAKEIAARFGISESRIPEYAKAFGLPLRQARGKINGTRPTDPR